MEKESKYWLWDFFKKPIVEKLFLFIFRVICWPWYTKISSFRVDRGIWRAWKIKKDVVCPILFAYCFFIHMAGQQSVKWLCLAILNHVLSPTIMTKQVCLDCSVSTAATAGHPNPVSLTNFTEIVTVSVRLERLTTWQQLRVTYHHFQQLEVCTFHKYLIQE
jgi:hypothetical protein